MSDDALPEELPVVDCALNDNDEEHIDLMDGNGLKAPNPDPPDVVFGAEDIVKPVKEVKEKVLKAQKFNKNGTPRKPMSQERLNKLAIAREKALKTRLNNKKLRDEANAIKTRNAPKVTAVITPDTPDTQYAAPIQVSTPAPAPVPIKVKRSVGEKKKDIEDAVKAGVKEALDQERAERKERKTIKLKLKEEKDIEDKKNKEERDKQQNLTDTLNKLNDIDGFYDTCFNF